MINYEYIDIIANDDAAIKHYLRIKIPNGEVYNFPPPRKQHLVATLSRIFIQMNEEYQSLNDSTRLGFTVPEVKEETKKQKKK